MNFMHGFILANVAAAALNMLGMAARIRPPPIIGFVAIWLSLQFGFGILIYLSRP